VRNLNKKLISTSKLHTNINSLPLLQSKQNLFAGCSKLFSTWRAKSTSSCMNRPRYCIGLNKFIGKVKKYQCLSWIT